MLEAFTWLLASVVMAREIIEHPRMYGTNTNTSEFVICDHCIDTFGSMQPSVTTLYLMANGSRWCICLRWALHWMS